MIYCISEKYVKIGTLADNYKGNVEHSRRYKSEINITIRSAINLNNVDKSAKCLEIGFLEKNIFIGFNAKPQNAHVTCYNIQELTKDKMLLKCKHPSGYYGIK